MKTGTRFLESESESESETMRRVYAAFSAVCEIAGQRKIHNPPNPPFQNARKSRFLSEFYNPF